MDYAFAPGTSEYEDYLRSMLTLRTNTRLIVKAGLKSIADFLGELVAEAVTADDLVAGSHASDKGYLFLALDSTTTTLPINYEDLEQASTSGSIKIPAAIRGPTTSLHFKGCRIGADDASPFLKLLKQALDNPQNVTAPKYLHVLTQLRPFYGVFESMGYSYRVMSSSPFPDSAALIAAFVAGNFTQVDGTSVPATSWSGWVKEGLTMKPALRDKVKFSFPVAIVPKTGGIGAISNLQGECRSEAEPFTFTLTVNGTIPTAVPDQLALIKDAIAADATMQASHPYPLYKRLHFADFDSFWNGLNWKPSVNGADLIGTGTHYVYTITVPILKPGTTNELLFNFYPASGTPVMNFKEDNATYVMFGVA
jgi:hypothetical protein